MSEILISVVVPTYNRGNLLNKTILSLINQEFKNIEILVIDDGSTDETDAICQILAMEHTQLKYHKISNRERGAARNYGAQLAAGKYVNFFDSDDLAYPNHCSIAAEIIGEKENPEVFALSYDIRDEFGRLKKMKVLKNEVAKFITSGNDLSCNGVFIRRDIALRNPFSENRTLSASEDYELWLRLSAKYEFKCYTKISHAVIHHPTQSTLNFNPLLLIERKLLMLQLAFNDQNVSAKFGKQKKKMEFGAYSYISLHISLTGKNKALAFKYLIKGISKHPSGIFSRRILAIIKHLIIS